MCKDRPKQAATITNESKMIFRFIRLTAWTGLLRDKWCIQPATETNGIHVLYVCVCEVWYKSSQTHTYAEMAAAIGVIYHLHFLLFMKPRTHSHTLRHKHTRALTMTDRWHSPGPTHPIRAARYPPCPRLGPPNLTQGVNNNLNFN